MGKLILIGKILLVLIVVVLLTFMVKYADVIRSTVSNHTVKSVAGAKTSFESEVKNNVTDATKSAKQQVMNIKVSDVLNAFSRVKKIGQDIQNAKKYIGDQISHALKVHGKSTTTNK